MITRVTTQMSITAATGAAAGERRRVADATQRATTLQAIAKPSDDPVGTGSSMQVRKEQAPPRSTRANANDAVGWLATTDSACPAPTRC